MVYENIIGMGSYVGVFLLNCLRGYHLKFTGHFETQIYGNSELLSAAFHTKSVSGRTVNPLYS